MCHCLYSPFTATSGIWFPTNEYKLTCFCSVTSDSTQNIQQNRFINEFYPIIKKTEAANNGGIVISPCT